MIEMDGVRVELVKSIKFLGCIVDNNLRWQQHINFVCKKLAQGTALLRSVYYLYPMWVKRIMYFSYFYSHMSYCIAIWGNAAKVHVNRVVLLQKKAIRLMLGLNYNEHVKPHAVVNCLLMFDDIYRFALALLAFRYCVLKHNYNLFHNAGYVVSNLNVDRVTRGNVQYNLFIPYVRTSLRKNCVIHQCILTWNSLSRDVKVSTSVSMFKQKLFSILNSVL
jgi:hypothetical protein